MPQGWSTTMSLQRIPGDIPKARGFDSYGAERWGSRTSSLKWSSDLIENRRFRNAPSLKMNLAKLLLPLAVFLIMPTFAHAHGGIGEAGGFLRGIGHPLGGVDHLCAMIAVGLWAAQCGGRALWAVPLAFVIVMALAGAVGMMGINLPLIEEGIVLSVITLGVFIAATVRLPLAASIVIIALFSLCHGHAHGMEMPGTASGLAYAAGFVLATAFLHACGIGLGVGIQKLASGTVVRFAGAVVALCGAGLWIL
jgi:urease accessory protein